MKKIIAILVLFVSAKCFSQTENNFMQKNTFWDSVYFKAIQYHSGAGIVHLGIDTVVGSPTFGKLVRKTAITSVIDTSNKWVNSISRVAGKDSIIFYIGGTRYAIKDSSAASQTFQQVLTAGSALSGNNTVTMTGSDFTFDATTGGLRSFTTGGIPLSLRNNSSNTNSNVDILELQRFTSGTAASGISGGVKFTIENALGSVTANEIISKLTTVTVASETSQILLTGISKGVTDTVMALGGYINLTESSATKFTSTTLATGKIQGGSILITVEANDATDYQSRTLRFIWSAVNKAGTLTITLSTPEEVVALSSGTLTCTITAVDAGSGVLDFKANAVSSLTQSTLRATYQTFKNF